MKKSKFISESDSDEEIVVIKKPKPKPKVIKKSKKKVVKKSNKFELSKGVEISEPKSLNPFKGINDFIIYKKKDKKFTDTNTLFENKYKPKCIKDIIGHREEILVLKNWIKSKNEKKDLTKNFMLLYGPSGSGKNIIIRTLLEEFNYKIIEFNSNIYTNKKDMFVKLEKILNIKSIETLFFNSKIAILFTDIDKTLGEGVHYNKFIEILNKNKPLCVPVVCIYHCKKLKKKYNTPTKLDIIHINHSELSDLTEYGLKVMKQEGKTVTKKALKIIIEKSHFDVRKFLQNLKILSISSKKRFGQEDANKLLKFSATDIFLGAYEILDNMLRKKKYEDMSEEIGVCMPDQPLIIDLLYTNAPHLLNSENTYRVLDSISYSDQIQRIIFKEHICDLREYMIISSCIVPKNIIQQNINIKKNYIIKKNQLNNLPWIMIKNENTYKDTRNRSTHFKHKSSDIQYMMQNIIVPIIENPDTSDDILKEKVKYLSDLGMTFKSYQKLRNFDLNKTVNVIDKKIKKRIEIIFDIYSRENLIERIK